MKKPLHKHIGNTAKKFHGHITKYLYERDTIFATAWVFIFILMVKVLPMPNLHFFDAMHLALEDFDMNDISYAKLDMASKKPDPRIAIINIGNADREGIAAIIEKTAELKPKVMGLDAYFEGPRDSVKDAKLKEVIEKNKNLVMLSRLEPNEKTEKWEIKEDYYKEAWQQSGFGNLIGENKGSVRMTTPYEKVEDSVIYSFAATLVKNYSPDDFKTLKKRKDHYEIINYTRRVNNYMLIEPEQLFNGEVGDSAIEGKIVLLGYVNEDPFNIEDKVFTPMNPKFAGKSTPDMNGIVVHANIISMILDHNYVKKLPFWVALLVAIIIGWLHMSFFIRYYLENHIWFHLVAKLAQLVSAVFFVYVGIFLYNRYAIKLDMSLTLVVIVLSVDIIYFYEAWATWMHKKFNYHTVFKPHQH